MWNEFGDLLCTTCGLSYEAHGRNAHVVTELARARGWHLFEGRTVAGIPMISHLCPKCVGTNRSKLPAAPQPLAADQFLF